LIFINDIVADIESNIFLFADDTCLLELIDDYYQSFNKLNRDLVRLSTWSSLWLVVFNAIKTFYIIIQKRAQQVDHPDLILNGNILTAVNEHKHLGLTITSNFSWYQHIHNISSKAAKCVALLKRVKKLAPRACLELLYTTMIRAVMEYGDVIFDSSPDYCLKLLDDVQREAALACTSGYLRTPTATLYKELAWEPLTNRRKNHRLSIMYKIQNNLTPEYLRNACPPLRGDLVHYQLRNQGDLTQVNAHSALYYNSFFPRTIRDWNNLSMDLRQKPSLESFKSNLIKKSGITKFKYFSHSIGRAGIHHCRMRMGLSALAHQRGVFNLTDATYCINCGHPREDLEHFFFFCPTYRAQRTLLLTNTAHLFDTNLETVLFGIQTQMGRSYLINILLRGDESFDLPKNIELFQLVQTYIFHSNRFI